MNATANTGAANGDGVFISDADADAGKAAYIIARVNYLRPQLQLPSMTLLACWTSPLKWAVRS